MNMARVTAFIVFVGFPIAIFCAPGGLQPTSALTGYMTGLMVCFFALQFVGSSRSI